MADGWYYWRATWKGYMIKAAHLLRGDDEYTAFCGFEIAHPSTVRPAPEGLPRCKRCLRRLEAMKEK